MCDVIQKDATLQQQRGILLCLATSCCDLGSTRSLFLEDRVALSNLLCTLRLKSQFFTTENDTLEQEDVIFAVDVGLGHNENIFEQKFTKVGDMVTFPILDSAFEVSDCLHILSSSLSFVNLVGNTFGGCGSSLKFVMVWIDGGRCNFQKRLAEAWSVGDTYCETSDGLPRVREDICKSFG